MVVRCITSLVAAGLLLAGCAALRQAADGERPPGWPRQARQPRAVPMRIAPLPGRLDGRLVFNSNNPEVVTEPGITLSTWLGPAAGRLDQAFVGRFSVFSHHIARDVRPGARLLRLGLLAHNPLSRSVTLRLLQGASWLSQPDSPFVRLAPMLPDPAGAIWAGPGDRVATDMLHGRSPLAPTRWVLPPRSTRLLLDLPVPTDVAIPPPVNGRTTMLRLEASGRVHLSEVAAFAPPDGRGGFGPVSQAAFEALLSTGRRAGPAEPPATDYRPDQAAPAGFRYGRVGGVTAGEAWRGQLTRLVGALAEGQRLGVPISSVHLSRLGTARSQSAPMRVRYAEAAREGHGNYGVTYVLDLALHNPDPTPRAYALALSHPVRVEGKGTAQAAIYLAPPEASVTFRGAVRVDEPGSRGAPPRFTHLVLRRGQELPPFEVVGLAGKATRALRVTLVYPADATPPQLLTVQRLAPAPSPAPARSS
ncbi:MAG: DUF3370 family protein [Candidatus Sericytochromatia bacterium]|nr:DUF3370 family protein [Candidatus Sericytochromatia bacterium]